MIGTVVGLAQYRLKRLLAYSTISHVGFLLLALSVNSEESVTSFLFYLMQYSITNLNAFFVVLALGFLISGSRPQISRADQLVINTITDRRDKGTYAVSTREENTDLSFISQLKGQFYANPILGLSLAVCLFSMAGIPPLVGFFAKYMVLYSAIENGYYFLALVGILASVISAAYYLRIIRVIHFESSPSDLSAHSSDKSEESVSRTLSYQSLFDSSGDQLLISDEHSQRKSIDKEKESANSSLSPGLAINCSSPMSTRKEKNRNDQKRDITLQGLTSAHSYVIAALTLFIVLFILSPS